jgi:3',5'-cyclic AMP phosphodiesterase CpdA
MNSLFQIAHISDPHISRQYYRDHIKSFKILLRAILDNGIDHVIITGDIVSTGNKDDYFLAREILAGHGLLNSNRLTVVPGNHDIFGGPHRAVDILSFPRYIRSVDYMRNKELFQNAFAETFEGIERISPIDLFPFIKKVGPFNIIGLNSVPPWSLRKNPLGTNGMLDEQQIESLKDLASASILDFRTNIVAIHHHFNDLLQSEYDGGNIFRKIESNTMRMRKRKKILKLFQSIDVQYVLHGHIHRNELYERNNVLFANGAGAVCDDPVKYLKYNLLTYSDDHCNVMIRQLHIPYQVSLVMQEMHRMHQTLQMPILTMKRWNNTIDITYAK